MAGVRYHCVLARVTETPTLHLTVSRHMFVISLFVNHKVLSLRAKIV